MRNFVRSTMKDERNSAADSRRKFSPQWILVGLVLFWAVELLLVQHWTTFPESAIPLARVVKDSARRLVLNIAFISLIVYLFQRWALSIAFVIGFLAVNGLLLYSEYFGLPLSWPVLSGQWREGLAVADHGWSLVSIPLLTLTGSALVTKLGFQFFASRHPQWQSFLTSRHRLKGGCIAAAVYVVFGYSLAGVHKPIRRIHMGNPPYIYGYLIAWTTEALTFDHEALRALALEKASLRSDRVSKLDPPIQLQQNVAVIQVESLDFGIVHAENADEKVMPFLSSLTERSRTYLVTPFHNTGSSEADFSTLTASTPNGKVNPFQVHGFPYEDTLPRIAKTKGYRVVAMHGNTGEFFHRRSAYEQMGFDQLLFTEELTPQGVDGRQDHDLLQYSAKLLNESEKPTLHFIITITSHGPFDKLEKSQRKLFPDPANTTEHYLNSMRYVDSALRDYVAALPTETTVIIYGDHGSSVSGYSESEKNFGRVPWIVYQKNRDISKDQYTSRTGLANSGELTQLDMVTYLRNGFQNQLRFAKHSESRMASEESGTEHRR